MSKTVTLTITLPSDPENQSPESRLTGDVIEGDDEALSLIGALYNAALNTAKAAGGKEFALLVMTRLQELAIKKYEEN